MHWQCKKHNRKRWKVRERYPHCKKRYHQGPENPELESECEKNRKILNQRGNIKKNKFEGNPGTKKEYEKNKYDENPKTKREYEKHKYQENPESKRECEKKKYDKNPEPKQENRKKMHKKNKKCLNKVATLCQQIRQGRYFICTVCHRFLYKQSVRLFEHEKYIITAELVRSFDKKTNICDTYHKHLSRNEIPCQVVSIKWV